MSIDQFCTWLAHTPLSLTIGAHHWVTPALQTVHILAVATVLASVLMVDLRLLGVSTMGHFPMFARRYMPWIWRALVVLLLTGGLLLVGEPVRELKNWVFITKMMLVCGAAGLTFLADRPIRTASEAGVALPAFARPFAVLSLVLWVAIIFAGRWIAYV